jgi:hypothetical protein
MRCIIANVLQRVPHALNPCRVDRTAARWVRGTANPARWASAHSAPPLARTKPGSDFRFFLLGLTLLAVSACGGLARVHECQGVVETVNAGLDDLHVQVPDAGTSAAAYAQIADGYEALGKRLDELAPSDTALAKAVASYRELTDRAAKQSRSYSEALAILPKSKKERTDNEARLNRIRTQAKADLAKEATVVRKLNAVCHP